MRIFGAAALALAVAGCVTVRDGPVAIEADAISYETGPCFGACPVYKVTVRSDGTGVFEGRRFTSLLGTRSFRLTAAQYRAFANVLAPLRPARGSVRYSGDKCRMMATDLPSAEVTWTGRGATRQLYFYFGCDMEKNRAIAERIRKAPERLPIARFIRDPASPPPTGR